MVFLSDNGPNSDRFRSGLRGHKGSVYEGGCRVPFLIRWSGHLGPGGTKVDTIAGHIDILPTLSDLCGIPLSTDRPLDGRSLVPIFEGETTDWPDRKIFTHQVSHQDTTGGLYPGAVRTQRYNLIDGVELYDVVADPGETSDLSTVHPDVVANLGEAFQEWYADVNGEHGYSVSPVPVG